MDSATAMARRTFSSEEPTKLPNMRPMSKRSSGSCQSRETALAHRLLPQPCTPSSNTPFGAGRPKARASAVKATARLLTQSFKHAQAAHAGEVLLGRVILQQPALADDLLLLGEDLVDVRRRSGAGS